MPLVPSKVINGRYELTSLIAEGGMGEVWKAVDRRLNRTVAIKTVRARYLRDEPKALSIFYDEAKAGAHLMGHSNVVNILDVIEQEDEEVSCLIVMEYVEGVSLQRWISEVMPKLAPEIAYLLNLHVAWQFCRAIQAAHSGGILHRDIKPLNAILSLRGSLKVTDFGLARFVDAVTRTHTVAGAKTVAYAAPEQWRDEKYGKNTDIYQLGCTLYQLFTGGLPFGGMSLPALMNAHLNVNPKSTRERNSLIAEELDSVVLKMMAKDPEERGSLWQLNDAVCEEMCRTYELGIEFKGMPTEMIALVYKVTEMAPADDDKERMVTIDFPDAHEVLEEGIALALANVKFKLRRGESLLELESSASEPNQPSPPGSASAESKAPVPAPSAAAPAPPARRQRPTP